MKVAVTCVKNIRDAQAGLLAELIDFAENLRQRGARDDAVLNDVVRRDASHSGESRLAPLPDERALGLRLRQANFAGAICAANLADVAHQRFDFRDGAIELNEEKPATVRIIRVDGRFRS